MHKTTAFQPIRALSSALDLLMKAPLPLWVGGVVLATVQGLSQIGSQIRVPQNPHQHAEEVALTVLPFVLFGICLGIVVSMITAWLRIGYWGGIRTVMREGDVEFGELYRASNRWLGVFLTMLLQTVMVLVSLVPFGIFVGAAYLLHEVVGIDDDIAALFMFGGWLLYLPVLIYLELGFVLMPYPAALEGAGPVESLRISWGLASGVRLQMIGMGLLSFGLVIAGLLMCCIGVIPAGIIVEVMWCEAYVQATREGDGWWVDHRGRGDGPGPEDGWEPSGGGRLVEDTPVTPSIDSAGADPGDGEGFDPSAWRKET